MNNKSLFEHIRAAALLAIIGGISGCGGGGGGDGSGAPGAVSVAITDAPACGFDAVNVTVGKVRIHQSDSAVDGSGDWVDIVLDPPQRIDLLTLNDPTQPNFALVALGQTPLPAGHYTQLRLVLVPNPNHGPFANSVVITGPGTEMPLETPSAVQSGLKLIHSFTVEPGARVDLLLDFDACRSIVRRGNGDYALKPVVRVIPYTLNGIEGYLNMSLFPNQTNTNNVVVSAQVNGGIARAVVPNAATGKFFLAHLPAPATYDVVLTANGHASAVIAGVPVGTATTVTPVSDAAMPIALSPSGAQSITGAVTLSPADDDDARVEVTARQSLVNGPTVVIKSAVASADPSTPPGDYRYSLSLPVAAPGLGVYTTSLPIPIDATGQGTAAGAYVVTGYAQSGTMSYATQTPAPATSNITGGNATSDFTLSP